MFVVFEGIDGSGKQTQTRMLVDRLSRTNSPWTRVFTHGYPEYEHHVFGGHIRRYLRGEYGDLASTHPLLTAVLFAADRLEGLAELRHHLYGISKSIVICDRYVPSNIAHQGAKTENWQELAKKIAQIEYGVFALPQPDIVIILDIPAEQSFKRTHSRDAVSDLHQDNLVYLSNVREIYLELARTTLGWHVVKCFDGDRERTPEEIHEEVANIVLKSAASPT